MEKKTCKGCKATLRKGQPGAPDRLGYLIPRLSLWASNGAEPDMPQKKATGFSGIADNPCSLLNIQMQIRRWEFFLNCTVYFNFNTSLNLLPVSPYLSHVFRFRDMSK